MPTKTCAAAGWTELTAAAGPARIKVQKLSVGPLHLLAAATDPGAGQRAPGVDDDALMLTDLYQVYSETALAGTTLRLWARPVRDEAVTVLVTTVM